MTAFEIIFILELLEGLEGKFLPRSLTQKISLQGSEHDHFPLSFFHLGALQADQSRKGQS